MAESRGDKDDCGWRCDLAFVLITLWIVGMTALSLILTALRIIAEWRAGWNQ